MSVLDSNDKRYKLLDAAMRRYGYQANALIEALHTAQQSYGFLDPAVLRMIAQKLKLPASKVYGVATFYNLFTLKPQGEHTCVVCTGTACYIKGAALLLRALDEEFGVTAGKTTPDRRLSVLQARCFGSCASAPAATLDGRMAANQTPELLTHAVHAMLERAEAPAEKSAGEKIA